MYTHCNILVDMYLNKHVTTAGCQFYVDLYPPQHYLFLRYVHYVIKTEKTFKNEQRSKDAAAKKRPNTSGVGKINNYYEDIYIPHNNTD